MRKIIALMVLIAVILLGSPWVSGKIVHHRLDALVKHMNEASLKNGAQFSLDNYHQGWFQSTAHINMHVTSPVMSVMFEHMGLAAPKDVNSVLAGQVTIDHGPVIWGGDHPFQFLLAKVRGTVSFHNAIIQAVLPEFNQKGALLTLDADLHYSDRLSVGFDSPGFTLAHEKSQVRWGGFSGNIHTSSRNDVLKLEATVKPFSYVDPSINFNVGALHETVDVHKTHWGFWVGQVDLQAPLMALQNKEPLLDWAVKKLKLNVTMSTDDDNVSQVFHASLGELNIDGETYAPVTFVFLMKNLNAPALGELYKFLRTHPPKSLAVMSRGAEKVMPLFLNLIHKDTTVGVDVFDLTVPQGKVHFSLKVFWPEDTTYKSAMGAFMAMHSHGVLEVPVAFVDDMMNKTDAKFMKNHPQLVAPVQSDTSKTGASEQPAQKMALPSDQARDSLLNWRKQGYVTKEGSVYKATLAGQGMSVKINGKSFPPH